MRTVGLSPKVIATAVTGAVVVIVRHFLHVDLSVEVQNAISLLVVTAAGIAAPPGRVEDPFHVGPGNDAALPPA